MGELKFGKKFASNFAEKSFIKFHGFVSPSTRREIRAGFHSLFMANPENSEAVARQMTHINIFGRGSYSQLIGLGQQHTSQGTVTGASVGRWFQSPGLHKMYSPNANGILEKGAIDVKLNKFRTHNRDLAHEWGHQLHYHYAAKANESVERVPGFLQERFPTKDWWTPSYEWGAIRDRIGMAGAMPTNYAMTSPPEYMADMYATAKTNPESVFDQVTMQDVVDRLEGRTQPQRISDQQKWEAMKERGRRRFAHPMQVPKMVPKRRRFRAGAAGIMQSHRIARRKF